MSEPGGSDPGGDAAARQPLPVYLIHWDAPDWVRSACMSISASRHPVSVRIVNNGPQTDLGVADDIRIIHTGKNLGFAAGANRAIHDAMRDDHEFVVIAAHDLHLRPDALEVMVGAALAEPRAGVLAPILSTNAVGEPLGHHDLLDLRTMVSGTCMLLRRLCILDVGGFEPLFGSYGEDDDLCARAQERGWLVARVPGAHGHGLGSRTTERRWHRYPNLVLLAYRTSGIRGATRMALGHLRAALTSALSGDWTEARLRARGAVGGIGKVVGSCRGARREDRTW